MSEVVDTIVTVLALIAITSMAVVFLTAAIATAVFVYRLLIND